MKTKLSIVLLVSTVTISCSQSTPEPTNAFNAPVLEVSMYDSPSIDKKIAMEHPYDLVFNVEQNKNGQYILYVNIALHGGSFFVSPHSQTEFKGRFNVDIAESKALELSTEFTETPRSREVIDPHRFVNGPVNWITQDTRYAYPLKVNSTEDFDIGGRIRFVIEPKCTLEEIPMMFKMRNGRLTVEPGKC